MIIDIPEGDRDWTLYSKTVELPAGAAKVYAVYLNWSGNSSSTGTIWLDGAQFQQAPSTSRTFSDGLGRSMQRQQPASDSTIVVATDYDTQGRVWKQWAPYLINDFGTFDDDPDTSSRLYFNKFADLDHNQRPYVETIYKNDPLNRPDKIYPVAISDALQSVRMTYGTEQIGGSGARYFYTSSQDEDERIAKEYVDSFDNTVQTDAGTSPLSTKFVYDALEGC